MVIRVNSVKRMKVKMVVMIFECCFFAVIYTQTLKDLLLSLLLSHCLLSFWSIKGDVIGVQFLDAKILSPFTLTENFKLTILHSNEKSVIVYSPSCCSRHVCCYIFGGTHFSGIVFSSCHAKTLYSDLWLSTSKKDK